MGSIQVLVVIILTWDGTGKLIHLVKSFDFRNEKKPNCGEGCSEVPYDTIGKYSTHLFSDEAVRIIQDHDKSKPLFLYLSYQAVHSPGEVPAKYVDLYNNTIKDQKRKKYAGMVTCMDEGIGNVTRALKEKYKTYFF